MAQWEKILIALVFFSVIVTAGFFVITDLGDTYSHTLNLSNNFSAVNSVGNLSKLDVTSSINSTVQEVIDVVQGQTNSTGIWRVTEFGILFIEGIGAFFKLIFNVITLPLDLVDALTGLLGLPNFIRFALKTVIIIIFLFVLARLIFKKDRV